MGKNPYSFPREALFSAKSKYDCYYDDSVAPLKRNLLFVSILGFFALTVSPSNGQYAVNLGVITGAIDHPALVFGGLLAICAYHLYLYWLKCRATIINATNFAKVESAYMFELAGLHAFDEWNSLVKEHLSREVNMAIGGFKSSPMAPREKNGWKVRGQVESAHLEKYPKFMEALKQNPSISVLHDRGFAQIDYLYIPKFEDYQFLVLHRDHFWLTKRSQFIEYVLPVLVGFAAIMFLSSRVMTLLITHS